MKIDINYLAKTLNPTKELIKTFFGDGVHKKDVVIEIQQTIYHQNYLSISIPHYEYLIYENGEIVYLSCSAPESLIKPFEIVLFLLKNMKKKAKIGSYIIDANTKWGYGYRFTTDTPIDIKRKIDLIEAVINIKP